MVLGDAAITMGYKTGCGGRGAAAAAMLGAEAAELGAGVGGDGYCDAVSGYCWLIIVGWTLWRHRGFEAPELPHQDGCRR